MGSAKTMNLLAVAHTYRQQGKSVRLMKPRVDERFSEKSIVSRAGLHIDADELLGPRSVLEPAAYAGVRLAHTMLRPPAGVREEAPAAAAALAGAAVAPARRARN